MTEEQGRWLFHGSPRERGVIGEREGLRPVFRERENGRGERAITGYVARAGEGEMVSASTCTCLCFCKFSTLFSSSPHTNFETETEIKNFSSLCSSS